MTTVFVTGISGYIGSHCAVKLLENNYVVKGSVRNIEKSKTFIKQIVAKAGVNKTIDTVCLDLLDEHGWEEALSGCDYLLHVASPFAIAEPKDSNDMIIPALEGTKRILAAAKKVGIKKVVLTSSLVAMVGDRKLNHLTQESWSNADKDKISVYMKSKTYAEKAAWDFYHHQSGDDKMELTVINPGPVYGPPVLDRIDGASMGFFCQVLSGKMDQMPPCSYPMSDVRDIADIHVKAIDNISSNGQRLIVTTDDSYGFIDVGKLLSENGYLKKEPKLAPVFLLKILSLFNSELKGMMPFIGAKVTADNSAPKKLFNWTPIPFEKTVLDTAKSLTELKSF